jgi:hypothetical protein
MTKLKTYSIFLILALIVRMDYSQSATPSSHSSGFGLITIIYLFVGLVCIFYLYRYLYTSADSKSTVLSSKKNDASVSPDKLPTIPTPYEGGEYSFNTWIYISSFNKNRNTRKHIFELQGQYFSTLLVGLGAFNNTLMVRTHTNTAEGFQSGGTGTGGGTIAQCPGRSPNGFNYIMTGTTCVEQCPSTGYSTLPTTPITCKNNTTGAVVTLTNVPVMNPLTIGNGATGGSGVTGNPASGAASAAAAPGATGTTYSAVPPNAAGGVGDLSIAAVNKLFTPLAMDDTLLTTPVTCDLPEIDMQRWTMVSVILSGRTIDVYIDGKLSRSCMAPSYYKVDPTGVKPVMSARGGFDGYIGTTSVANYAMNPDEIYRTYLTGPDGPVSLNVFEWIVSLFKGSAA